MKAMVEMLDIMTDHEISDSSCSAPQDDKKSVRGGEQGEDYSSVVCQLTVESGSVEEKSSPLKIVS